MANLNQFQHTFTGRYKYFSTTCIEHKDNGQKLIITRRKEQTDNKPLEFLLCITANGQRNYVSSLYPVDDNYCFEKTGKVYFMELLADEVIISENSNYRSIIQSWLSRSKKV